MLLFMLLYISNFNLTNFRDPCVSRRLVLRVLRADSTRSLHYFLPVPPNACSQFPETKQDIFHPFFFD